MHRFSKYSVNHVGVGRSYRSDIVFPRSNGIESVQTEIPYLLRENLRLYLFLIVDLSQPSCIYQSDP